MDGWVGGRGWTKVLGFASAKQRRVKKQRLSGMTINKAAPRPFTAPRSRLLLTAAAWAMLTSRGEIKNKSELSAA